MSPRLILAAVWILMCSLFLALCGCNSTTDKIRVNTLHSMNYAAMYIADEKGFFRQQGIEVELKEISGSSASIPAMLHGDLDIITSSPNARLFNALVQNGNMLIIGDVGRGTNELLISKKVWEGGGINSINDLKGKTLSVSQLGSGSYYMLGKVLEKYNLSMSDVKLKYVDEMNAVAALEAGSLDGGIINDPYATHAIEQKIAVNPFKSEVHSIFGQGVQLSVLVTTRDYAERNPAKLRGFFIGYVKAINYYEKARLGEEPYRKEVVSIISKETGISPEEINRVEWPYLALDGKPDLASIKDAVRFFDKEKLIDKKPILEDYVNLEYLPR